MKKQITLADVTIDIYDGPIGISVSGGADSSLLLYILMIYATGPIHVFTCASKEKNRVAPVIASNVIGHCIDATNFNQSVYHHVYFVDSQTLTSWRTGMIDINKSLQLSHIYTAVTSNPSKEVTNRWSNGDNGLNHERDPMVSRPTTYHNLPMANNLHTPFFNVDKLKIKEIYDELKITDTLFPVTRSCESFELITGHCGECWWCQERQWAFGRLE